MPFPLAHPAAVLPLRRFCPKYLSMPALVVGSICPDAGYLSSRFNFSEFSHQFAGSLGFCLPVGLVALLFVYYVAMPVIERLPNRVRQLIPPRSWIPLGPPLAVLLSLLLGAWTHLLWDSFTHTSGWFVQHLPVLHAPLWSVSGRTVRVCHFLWYGCSFAGVMVLFLAYARWRQGHSVTLKTQNAEIGWSAALLVAALVLPVELIHHLVHGAVGRYLVAVLSLMLVLVVLLKTKSTEKPKTT